MDHNTAAIEANKQTNNKQTNEAAPGVHTRIEGSIRRELVRREFPGFCYGITPRYGGFTTVRPFAPTPEQGNLSVLLVIDAVRQ